jgi:hypothetical protein
MLANLWGHNIQLGGQLCAIGQVFPNVKHNVIKNLPCDCNTKGIMKWHTLLQHDWERWL